MKPFETFAAFWDHNRVAICTDIARALEGEGGAGAVMSSVKDAAASAWAAGGCSLAGHIGIEFGDAGPPGKRERN